jgi:hypothetical protein
MATIIIKNSTGSGVIPSSLQQGELAINTKDGKLFYGSGSGNIVKEFKTETGSFATTGSNTFNGNQIINGNVTISGTASINTLIVNQIGYSSGSNQLGDAANDTQTLFGTVRIPTGSLTVTGSLIVSGGVDVTGNSLFRGQVSTTTGFYISSTGAALNFYGGTTGTSNSYVFNTYGSTNNVASNNFVNISRTYDPTSGTGVYNMLLLEPTINQTGGANGITRGLYVNPTLTSFIDFRAIENVRGNNLLNSTSGNTYIGLSSNAGTARLQVRGSGTTSATTALRVENTNASASLVVLDNGNIGIGTTTPTASLHISASNSSSAFSFLVQNGAGQTLIGVQNDRTVNINSTNTANGNTTIGTTNGSVTFNQGYNNVLSRNALTFYNGGDASTIQGWTGNPGIAIGYAQSNSNPNTGSAFTVRGTTASSGSGVLFVTGSSATRLLTIASETSSSILVVSGSGNIGVGTNNPSANIHIVNSSSAAFRLQNVGGSSADFSISAGNSRFELVGNGASSGRITILQGAKYVGINQQTPTAAFHIVGAGATSATTTLLVQNSTPTNIITVLDNGTVGIRRAPTSSLDIAGTTRISGSFNTAISGAILTVIGSGSTQPIFTVQGSQGELFSINDSLSGSLFSVNDISGLPILEVFSDNTTLIGDYQDPMLITTKKVTMTNSGSFVVYSLPTASYDTAFFDYSIKSGSNARAGQIMAIQSGASVNFTETTTTDFGNTTAVSFTVIVSGSNMILTGSAATGSWTIKSIIRGL